jgi:hypothetical protein
MALVSHVNAENAALTASGIANLPAPLPVQEQVAIVPVTPTRPTPVSNAALGVARVSHGLGNAHDATAAVGAAPQLSRPKTGATLPLRVPSTVMALTTACTKAMLRLRDRARLVRRGGRSMSLACQDCAATSRSAAK